MALSQPRSERLAEIAAEQAHGRSLASKMVIPQKALVLHVTHCLEVAADKCLYKEWTWHSTPLTTMRLALCVL